MISVFGLSNCDTVRRARRWLGAHGAAHSFHDIGRTGLAPEPLDRWIAALGADALINRRGTTWRRLAPALRDACETGAGARECMLAHPALIKRPVVQWPDGAVTVGFDEAGWAARLA